MRMGSISQAAVSAATPTGVLTDPGFATNNSLSKSWPVTDLIYLFYHSVQFSVYYLFIQKFRIE
jgi:hypothetical protein